MWGLVVVFRFRFNGQQGVRSTSVYDLKTLARLNQLWDRYRRAWRRLLSPKVRAELRLRARFDIDLMSPWQISNKVPTGTIPDCARCKDICCRGLENVVSLRLCDVATLIDVGRTELMTREKPVFPPELLHKRPGLRALEHSELWQILPVLRQVGADRHCAALTPELKCALYPNWPSSCERFPYTLSMVRRQVRWGTRCPSQERSPTHKARSKTLFRAAITAYNERIRDAVLLTHARPELDALGIGAWLSDAEVHSK